jgi:hypothetical protein
LIVLNTLSTAIDDIIPYIPLIGGLNDKRSNLVPEGISKILYFPRKSFMVGVKE